MSAVASVPTTRGTAQDAAVPMTTLIAVELRKMTDTRAGRWLLAGVGVVTVLVLGIAIVSGDAGTRSFTNLVALAQVPLSILIPILGVLAATSEWSQRTVLSTFSLVPSRSRVVTAKVLAALVLGLIAIAFGIVAAAVGAAVAPAVGPATSDWNLPVGDLGKIIVYGELSMLFGVAIGTLLLNSALAIVLYFVLPTIWGGLTTAIGALKDAQPWIDSGTAWQPLVDPASAMDGTAWAQVGTASLIWIVLPLVLGLVRVLRKEVD